MIEQYALQLTDYIQQAIQNGTAITEMNTEQQITCGVSIVFIGAGILLSQYYLKKEAERREKQLREEKKVYEQQVKDGIITKEELASKLDEAYTRITFLIR